MQMLEFIEELAKKICEIELCVSNLRGLEVQTSTPAEFAARQSRDLVSFAASMKAAGFQPE